MPHHISELLEEQTLRQLLFFLDLVGTFVFAISGAMLGVKRRLDLFGLLALSFAASSAGGIARDLLIGSVPPAALKDWRYFVSAMLAGLIIFFFYSPVSRWQSAIQVFDAAGLALFAVAGAQKALAFHLNALTAAMLGMLSGIGGGITRDLLAASTPVVLQGDIYAVAALLGAGLAVSGSLLGLPVVPTTIGSALVCFLLRLAAIHFRWHLPTAPVPTTKDTD